MVDPDSAEKAMEKLSSALNQCTEEELTALKKVANAEYRMQKADKAPTQVLEYYKYLLEYIGLEDDE